MARVGIGRTGIFGKVLAVVGESEFVDANITNDLDVTGEQLLNAKSKVFQRADANNSLSMWKEISFSLQTDRTLDPTMGSIALQLNDSPSTITMNRATTMNQT